MKHGAIIPTLLVEMLSLKFGLLKVCWSWPAMQSQRHDNASDDRCCWSAFFQDVRPRGWLRWGSVLACSNPWEAPPIASHAISHPHDSRHNPSAVMIGWWEARHTCIGTPNLANYPLCVAFSFQIRQPSMDLGLGNILRNLSTKQDANLYFS